MRAASFLVLGALALLGCATVPGPHSADERARQARRDEQQHCSGAPADLRPLAPPNVERVEPLYFTVQHGRGNVDRELRGAQLYIRPAAGVTPQWIEAALACHRARRVLGRGDEAAPAQDPFVLPNAWVDIQVNAGDAAFVVTVRSEEPRDNAELLARARAFAGAQASR
jgi:hypothetical protein